MTTKIKWRLANRPTPDEVGMLYAAGLLTKEEAREILISHETDEDRDKQSLQEEIKFLRSLVSSLSARSSIVEHIRTIQDPWHSKPWYVPYQAWCSTSALTSQSALTASGSNNSVYLTSGTGATATNAIYSVSGTGATSISSTPSFKDIQTF